MVLLVFEFSHNLIRLFRHLFVYVFALFVIFIDMLCLPQSVRKVFLHQQIYTFFTIFHTAGSIDTWSNFEDDITHRYFASVESTYIDDCFQSYAWILVYLFQSMKSQYTVLVYYRNNVGSNTYCTKIEQRDKS